MTPNRISVAAIVLAVLALALGGLGFAQTGPLQAQVAALQASVKGADTAVQRIGWRRLRRPTPPRRPTWRAIRPSSRRLSRAPSRRP